MLVDVGFYANRTVLVTGGSGFLGSNLVRRLLEAGATVRVLGRSLPSDAAWLRSAASQVQFVQGDLRDAACLQTACTGTDVIFNLAARSGAAASNATPFEDLDVNARGQLLLLDTCRRFNLDAKIVFASSRLVYHPANTLPVAESAPTGPLSLYGIHKLAAEQYHLLYSRLYGLSSVVLRITNPYGVIRPEKQQSGYGIINQFIAEAIDGKELSVYGDGSQVRDYVHVDDVTRAFLLAGAAEGANGCILNVGSGEPTSFRHMAESVIRYAGCGAVVHQPWPREAAMVETGDFVADVRLAARVLGWAPRVSFDDGIRQVTNDNNHKPIHAHFGRIATTDRRLSR